jgi:hypothetical protein
MTHAKDLNGGGPNFSLQMSFLKQYYQNFEGFRGCFKHPPPTQKPLTLKVPFEVRLFLTQRHFEFDILETSKIPSTLRGTAL